MNRGSTSKACSCAKHYHRFHYGYVGFEQNYSSNKLSFNTKKKHAEEVEPSSYIRDIMTWSLCRECFRARISSIENPPKNQVLFYDPTIVLIYIPSNELKRDGRTTAEIASMIGKIS